MGPRSQNRLHRNLLSLQSQLVTLSSYPASLARGKFPTSLAAPFCVQVRNASRHISPFLDHLPALPELTTIDGVARPSLRDETWQLRPGSLLMLLTRQLYSPLLENSKLPIYRCLPRPGPPLKASRIASKREARTTRFENKYGTSLQQVYETTCYTFLLCMDNY